MAASKSKGLAVSARWDTAGDLGIGVEVEGTFVSLITVPGFRVAQLAENAAPNTSDNDDDGSEGGSE
jgi:hypothetical protein